MECGLLTGVSPVNPHPLTVLSFLGWVGLLMVAVKKLYNLFCAASDGIAMGQEIVIQPDSPAILPCEDSLAQSKPLCFI